MKIVILGYTGSIGASVLKRLAKNNSFNIICVGRKNTEILIKNKKIKYLKWDFRSFEGSKLSFLRQANTIINCTGKTNNDFGNLEYINTIFIKKLIKYINKHKFKIRIVHLSSVSVYGQNTNFKNKHKIFTEDSNLKIFDLYSKSKVKAENFIKHTTTKHLNKNYSYTILRVSNVIGTKKKTNLFRFVVISFKRGFWIKCSEDILFNFIHVKDVAQAVYQVISKLRISKNKTYNVTNDFAQKQFYKNYKRLFKKRLITITISTKLLKFFSEFFPLPRKIINLFLLISSRIYYSNYKIKKELKFQPKYRIKNILNIINE